VGPFLIQDEEIKMNYKGYFLDGKVFDSSYLRGQPIKFKIGTKISGWNIGLTRFKSKGKGKLLIPSRFAYGEKGVEGLIPPNTPLIFDIEVIY
jgi:FKBP-type peptidyl-prolyl cis-trans isomerase FkpA/FKBP-type peptidyl-prolyl cis-trans isomerase FklB